MENKLKILIVDDSRIFRSIIEDLLKKEEYIEVIGSVRNGVKAIEFIETNRPDLVTLDVEMPEMDGFQTLEAIQKINSLDPGMPEIGSIMVSSHTKSGADYTIMALEAGAFDFVKKPESDNMEENIERLNSKLIPKIHLFFTKRGHIKKTKAPTHHIVTALRKTASKPLKSVMAVLIGVSTGGPKALVNILPKLSENVDLPIFIVQHMPPTFTQSLAKSLDIKCKHKVIECLDNSVVRNDHVYIAPGGQHMLLSKNSNGEVITVINTIARENGCRPSVDVLFRSAATVYGGNTIAIILTGMGTDGSKGLAPLKRAGCYAIAQDEETSVVWGMPGSAVETELVDKVLPLDKIPGAVRSIIQNKR